MRIIKAIIQLSVSILMIVADRRDTSAANSEDVVLVLIDAPSLNELGPFPFSRDIYGRFLDALYQDYSPKCVFIDVLIDRPQVDKEALDQELFRSIRGKTNLFFSAWVEEKSIEHRASGALHVKQAELQASSVGTRFSRGYLVIDDASLPVPEILRSGARLGFSTYYKSSNGRHEVCPTLFRLEEATYPSAPLAMALGYLGLKTDLVAYEDGALHVSGISEKVDQQGQFPVRFDGQFATVEFSNVLKRTAPSRAMQGKLVMLGASPRIGGAAFPTEVNKFMPATEFVAHATQTLVSKFRAGQSLGK